MAFNSICLSMCVYLTYAEIAVATAKGCHCHTLASHHHSMAAKSNIGMSMSTKNTHWNCSRYDRPQCAGAVCRSLLWAMCGKCEWWTFYTNNRCCHLVFFFLSVWFCCWLSFVLSSAQNAIVWTRARSISNRTTTQRNRYYEQRKDTYRICNHWLKINKSYEK